MFTLSWLVHYWHTATTVLVGTLQHVYNGCLAWYNVVLTPRIHSTVKYSQLGQSANICDVCKRPTRKITMTTNKEHVDFNTSTDWIPRLSDTCN